LQIPVVNPLDRMQSTRVVLCLAVASVVFGGRTATAQSTQPPTASQSPSPATVPERKWEIEVHGGLSVNGHQGSGSGSLPLTGAIIGGKISVSSFYFGQGTQLFNQNEAGISGGSAPTITPMDPVLLSSVVQRQRYGGTLGARVDRAISHRLTVDITFDYSPGNLAFTNTALAEIEAARASFTPALERALSVSSVASTVTSVATVINQQHAPQVFTTGALMVNLRETGKAIPYVTMGAGVVFSTGDAPTATLVGTYQLGVPGQVFGTDTVNLRYSLNGRTFVWLGGAGFKYFMTPTRGLRFDGRVQLYRNTIVNLVNTTPAIALESTGSPFPLMNSGALQFSSTAPLNGVSISAPGGTVAAGALAPGLTTFTGSGYLAQVGITLGFFFRF
jgi:hypothetical protein